MVSGAISLYRLSLIAYFLVLDYYLWLAKYLRLQNRFNDLEALLGMPLFFPAREKGALI